MKKILSCACMFLAILAQGFEIRIDQGLDKLTRMAVVPFQVKGNAPDVAATIANDLRSSGQFELVREEHMLSLPTEPKEIAYRDWRILETEYLVVGQSAIGDSGRLEVEFHVVDVHSERILESTKVTGELQDFVDVAHGAADSIYELLTGSKGIFSTKVIYILVENRATEFAKFSLIKSDWDGARETVLLTSDEPLMSPSWSPNGEHITYVSFESGNSAIHIMDLKTGEAEVIAEYEGVNSAPVYSPDGSLLAMTLSRSGNPEIYTMDVSERTLRQITDHHAIDTEATWSHDGKKLLFTSDRSGTVQIFQVDLDTLMTQRVTNHGSYNARARMLPDDNHLVFVHRFEGTFHIAWQRLRSMTGPRILSSKVLDESPSLSPNGSMLLYATKEREKGILAIVSVDGRISLRLPSAKGSVQEPAWSPFLPSLINVQDI